MWPAQHTDLPEGLAWPVCCMGAPEGLVFLQKNNRLLLQLKANHVQNGAKDTGQLLQPFEGVM